MLRHRQRAQRTPNLSGELRAVGFGEAVVELAVAARSPVLELAGNAAKQTTGIRLHDEDEEVIRGVDLLGLVIGCLRDIRGVVLGEDHIGLFAVRGE